MKLELDANGNAVLENGMPVYVYDDGSKKPFDASKAVTTITRLNGEAKGHRERAEAAETLAKRFEGLEDPESARQAIETVKGLDGKTKAEIDKVRKEIAATYTPQIEAAKAEAASAKAALHKAVVGGAIAQSKFLEKTVWTADVAEAMYGKDISVDEKGRFVGKDAHGAVVYSRTNHGEPADVDEFLQIRIDAHPRKEHILKADQKGGSGASPGAGGGKSTKQMPESDFNALSPKDQAARMAEGYALT
jgi:hypothetical protein